MNILEYIESLMDKGMSEEDASRCAYVMYNDYRDDEDDDYYDDDATDEDGHFPW